jgi:hypothetical protein
MSMRMALVWTGKPAVKFGFELCGLYWIDIGLHAAVYMRKLLGYPTRL